MTELHTIEVRVSPETYYDSEKMDGLLAAASVFAAAEVEARGQTLGELNETAVVNALIGVYGEDGDRQGWRIPMSDEETAEQYLVAWTWTATDE